MTHTKVSYSIKILIFISLLSVCARAVSYDFFLDNSYKIGQLQRYLQSKALLNNYKMGEIDEPTKQAIYRFEWLLELQNTDKTDDVEQILQQFKLLDSAFIKKIRRYTDFDFNSSRQFRVNSRQGIKISFDVEKFREPRILYQFQLENSLSWTEFYEEKLPAKILNFHTEWADNKPVKALKILFFDGPIFIKQKILPIK